MKKETNIVTLSGENGKNMDFEICAELEYDGYLYQILKPTKKYDDLSPEDAIVFRLEETSNQGVSYFVEENDDIINEIENIYNEGM